MEKPGTAAAAAVDPALLSWATAGSSSNSLPATSARQVEVHRLSPDFRQATRIVARPLPPQLPPGTVLIRRLYTGVNASDVNYTAGRYFGSPAAAEARLPFPAGFEAVGVVAAAAPGVQLPPGTPAATMEYGGFAEWAVVAAKHAFVVPEASPRMLALMTSGLTASIALEQAGLVRAPGLLGLRARAAGLARQVWRVLCGLPPTSSALWPRPAPQRKGQTVLVTAAAGGTGQIAVQLAVMAGCHVIGTCSGGAKETLLRWGRGTQWRAAQAAQLAEGLG